jgi:L,D-peptidoglycan transpeptidase YkuD (ErfK/YbiS/YcfS/YnhG family)
MTDKTKVVNYTPEMTAELVAAYTANPTKDTVAAFATKFGKTTKSVVAKLSREGVYVKATPTAKDGTPVAKKDTIVETIANAMGVPSEKLDGLEKAPKTVLKMILAAMA